MAGKALTPVMVELADEAATAALAAKVAASARPGDVFALSGPLGSGKTVFARAFINARAGAPQEVPSPTFTLVQCYAFANGEETIPVNHFDLFRIEDVDETTELGMDDAFAGGISLIEWPDRLGARLPADRLDVSFDQGPSADSRLASLAGHGSWKARLEKLVPKVLGG